MTDKIRQLIAVYITDNGDIEDWEETRILYSIYAYVSFLVIALKSIGKECDDIRQCAVDFGLETKENIDYIFNFKGAMNLAGEIKKLFEKEEMPDADILYQDFLSIDYVVRDEKIVFEKGKNSRTTLGAYYTQEEFAYEIAQKAMEEYLGNCLVLPEEVSIADFSCGGGAFLIAAKQYCDKRNIRAKLIGVDVDPIAVMITRARIYRDCGGERMDADIILGNPLLKKRERDHADEKFCMALKGRYYNSSLGLDEAKKINVVIGNPPWEKIRFEEKKFLAHYIQDDFIDTKENRKIVIGNASDRNKSFFGDLITDYENAKHEIKNNDRFKDTRGGELNTYALFTEYALNLMSENGITGLIVKSSLLKMPVYGRFMKNIMDSKKLYEIFMFSNRKKIFHIDSREEFSIVFFKNRNKEDVKIAFGLEDYRKFCERKKITISRSLLKLLNPETGMLPNIKNNEELHFLRRIYTDNPTFGEQYKDSHFGRLVHLTNHSQYIVKKETSGYLPVYEGKFIELYTGKYATFKGVEESEKYKSKAAARVMDGNSPNEYPEARFYIRNDIWKNLSKNFQEGYILAWRSLTSATNRRTMLATVLPLMPTCQSIQLLQIEEEEMIQILVLFNSIIFDYIVRLKMAGLDLTQMIIKQIPVPCKENFDRKIEFQGQVTTMKIHILSRLKFLYNDDGRVNRLFDNDQNYKIVNKTRKQIISELDILTGKLYGLEKNEIKEIASSFDKYYSKEEVEQWF